MGIEIYNVQKLFAERLVWLMREQRINITQLAERCKILRPTINNWLLLKRTPQIDSLVKLSDYFSRPIDYFLKAEYPIR